MSAANSGLFVDVDYRWWLADDLGLRVEVTPSPGWDCTWPRVGVRLDLPGNLTEASWFGTGPDESYPDTQRAARVGRFSAAIDDLVVGLLAAAGERPPGGAAGPGDRRRRRRTAAGPDGAPTPPDTGPASRCGGTRRSRSTGPRTRTSSRPSEQVYLFLDDAVHGIGSRACGLDVLPEHALWPSARAFTVLVPRRPAR